MLFNSTKLSRGGNSSIIKVKLKQCSDNVNDNLGCSRLTYPTLRRRP